MRRYLFTLLMILGLPNIMAQTTIVCNTEGELPELLAEKAKGLTEVKLSVIPSRSWDNLHSPRALHLPKTIDTLYLDAISCDARWYLIFVVSDKGLYIQDDSSWGKLNLMDENGIHWGTKVESISTNSNPDTPTTTCKVAR